MSSKADDTQHRGSDSKCLTGTSSSKAFRLLENQGIIVGKTMGSGSYATVKRAYDLKRKHAIAIKIISKTKASEEFLIKFLPREIEALRTLKSHYALIKCLQLIETTSKHFFIMELAENGDLLSTIKDRHNIPENEAGRWFTHLHDGITYMHSKGIVHRDIKCENLLIGDNDILKITDFGFAKMISKAKSGNALLCDTYCGSFAYAPPEILKGVPYDPEVSDVWSMGIVLFTMVYGQLPFDDSNPKKLLKQVQGRVLFPGKPDVSEECRILIIKILSKPSDRVPLRNIKSDPWFKDQRSLHVLEAVDSEGNWFKAQSTETNSAMKVNDFADTAAGPAECSDTMHEGPGRDTNPATHLNLAKRTGNGHETSLELL